jgi:hypothetical protein
MFTLLSDASLLCFPRLKAPCLLCYRNARRAADRKHFCSLRYRTSISYLEMLGTQVVRLVLHLRPQDGEADSATVADESANQTDVVSPQRRPHTLSSRCPRSSRVPATLHQDRQGGARSWSTAVRHFIQQALREKRERVAYQAMPDQLQFLVLKNCLMRSSRGSRSAQMLPSTLAGFRH